MERDREEMAPGDTEREKNGIRLDDSTELAFDLDVFLRKNVYAYREGLTRPKDMDVLAEELFAGQTADIRWWLRLSGRREEFRDEIAALMERVRAYEKEYGIPEPAGRESVRKQLADAKNQAGDGKGGRPHRKREMEK